MSSLSELLDKKENNVNSIKAAAAYLVIIGHAYAYACNYEQTDIMTALTGNAYNLGGFAVGIFFFFSGLFISKSLIEKGYGVAEYFKRRILRIFPPLIFVTVAIIIICGIFITDMDTGSYFTDTETYQYLLNCVFVSVHELPGVFTGNISGSAVNGPIWTIKFEFACYVMCYLFYALKLLTRKRFQFIIYLFIALAAVVYFSGGIFSGLAVLIRPVGMFLCGVMYMVYGNDIKPGTSGLLAAILLYAVFLFLGLPETGLLITLPYILCVCAFVYTGRKFGILEKAGEASYEIYLWGGFAGQTVTWLYGGSMSPWANMVITAAAASAAGILTHAVLKRFYSAIR